MDKVFHCRRCGNCCRWPGYVRVSAGEIDAIAAFLGVTTADFIADHTRLTADRSGLSLLENPDGSCPFLSQDVDGLICLLQSVKPRQCQDFPLKWNFPGWEKECSGVWSDQEANKSDA